ncbi:TetR/AcrR family transcriptional regulator [Nocardia uniformis]|uniref:TetR/AcrR family transcriptional regulator n=1 Tax=Nocardia uniformis TaxID=53432 RepID=A0A849C7C9_9NOCA|nr:TetR/AcrR family transcriptional regulator [Nocardia uniformis]NNH74663.1 TetR/AcrR family transcriptional regulator [Nocardia uniformis]
MLDKQSRIFDAAYSLFAEYGFESVTTQQISDRAEIAAGTLFRYAASKGELLLMVYNAEFTAALEAGERVSRLQADPVEAVVALVRPTLEAAADHVENAVAYQRELLFGSPAEKYRADGLALVARLEADIAERLIATAGGHGLDGPQLEEQARLAGRSVFAALHLALAQPATGAHPGPDAAADLRGQISQIVAGFHTALTTDSEKGEL